MNYYLVLKTVHLLAVVVFLGNIITGLFWMRLAVRTGDAGIIRHTVNGIIASDRWFTIPGVVIITACGITAAIYAGIPLLRTGWVFWPIVLFSLSGVFFMAKVAPLQSQMKKYLDSGRNGNSGEPDGFRPLVKSWEFWGAMALATPLVSFLLMVMKWPLKSPLAW